MEPIEIIIDDITYTALPMPDGSFEIFQEKNQLGTINPDLENPLEIHWVTKDLFSSDLAQRIGQAIEAKEM